MKYLTILLLLCSQASFGCYLPTIHNSFVIRITDNDKILINQKESDLLDLGHQLYNYYSMNSLVNKSDAFANYETFTTQECRSQISSIGQSGYNSSWIEKEKNIGKSNCMF